MNKEKVQLKLRVGDIIHASNPFFKCKHPYYRVEEIKGDKAITKYIAFNTKIHSESKVYEYVKRRKGICTNSYTLWGHELRGMRKPWSRND